MKQNRKQIILSRIGDACTDFTYYDRKCDNELSVEQLNNYVRSGAITIDEMVNEFRKHLEAVFLDSES